GLRRRCAAPPGRREPGRARVDTETRREKAPSHRLHAAVDEQAPRCTARPTAAALTRDLRPHQYRGPFQAPVDLDKQFVPGANCLPRTTGVFKARAARRPPPRSARPITGTNRFGGNRPAAAHRLDIRANRPPPISDQRAVPAAPPAAYRPTQRGHPAGQGASCRARDPMATARAVPRQVRRALDRGLVARTLRPRSGASSHPTGGGGYLEVAPARENSTRHSTTIAAPPRRGSPPPESAPETGSRATAWTPPK
ncbi:MAG: hypothetical protein QOE38_1987, partial [Thermoleophilaceae bacterium]|nr:hypothetical protein [Thermoleophilaceae bacterium]